MSVIDLELLAEPRLTELAARYALAEPFPHTVLENFVTADPAELAGAFPGPDWEHWASRSTQYQPGKSSCRRIEAIPPQLRDLVHELSEPPFLRALSVLTGLPNLLPDPFLEGGGLQWSGPGGRLLPHTDFHLHADLQLFRRTNVLVYLNPDWKEGDGGELGLYNLGSEVPSVLVPPRFGTCVVFTTDHRSVHGVTPISDTAAPRRSIALYYYTVESAEVFSGDRKTYWYETDQWAGAATASDRVRLLAMRSALRASKTLSRLAYRMDPQHPIKI
jgi:hypothetical protein